MNNPHDEKPKKPIGRPPKFKQEIADEICRRIANSTIGLNKLHEEDPKTFPHRSTVLRWLAENEIFRAQYAQAKADQMDYFGEEIIKIAYDDSEDVMRKKELPVAGGGKIVVEEENREFVNRSKLKIDTLKWLMSKLAPKKYGDKQEEIERDITIRVVEE